MHGKLIDEENYPRSDIDVYAVRVARNRIICKKDNILYQISCFLFFLKTGKCEIFLTVFSSVYLLTHSD